MRISQKSFDALPLMACRRETSSWRVEHEQGSFVFQGGSGTTVIVEGEVYYYLDKDDSAVRFAPSDDVCARLKRVYDSVGENGFSQSVEGMYNVAVINEERDTVSIFGDAFNRLDLFYCLDGKCPVISTEYEDVISCFDRINYDPAVLSCLLILGYPPMKHTHYSGLHRLAIGERLLLQNDKINLVKAKVKPLISIEMDEANLDQYADILDNAVLSRSSQSENWIELSSGWDSTTVLGVLRKYFDKSKVRAVIMAAKLSDGRLFNPYEVEKATKIAEYYSVPAEIAMVDLADAGMMKLWSGNIQITHSELMCEYMPMYLAMADVIREKGKADAAVFVGHYSDSLHNFGFSQYISLPYLSQDFRQYSDKLKSYLYSPSFLRKVLDNTFADDFAYKLFQWHYSQVEFADVSSMSRNQRIFHYLLSFVMSNSRLPFARFAIEPIFSSYAEDRLKGWLYENYFKDAVEQIDGDNMYFWLTWLYQHFHLQGYEKKTVIASIRGAGKRPCLPFYDLRLVKFLQTMPESWGRGLEWRRTKYPLRHYGYGKLKVPYEIIESSFHSYITESEAGRIVDIRSEIINNSVLTPTMRDLRNNSDLGKLFDKEWFNIAVLNDMLQTGKSEPGSPLPLRQLMLLSSGF